MNDFHTIDARGLDSPTAYRLITGCVVPRPIAWITTMDEAGLVNAAPFSSYNYVAHSPPMLAVNIGSRDGKLKDTARNMVASGEFLVNVATEAQLEALHRCGEDFPPEVSEPALLGIDLLPSTHIRPPRIAESPIQMECRLEQAITLGRGLNTLYIGEVLAFHLSGKVYDGRHVDSIKMRPLGRLAGPNYTALGEIFVRQMLHKPPRNGG